APALPDMPLSHEVAADYDTTGLSLKAHPVSFLRHELTALRVSPAAVLADKPDKAPIRVPGLVLVRQRPAAGHGTIFITIEDEAGVANLVGWPPAGQWYRQVARGAVALLVEGRVERSGEVIHVFADKMEDLSRVLQGIASHSRDFR